MRGDCIACDALLKIVLGITLSFDRCCIGALFVSFRHNFLVCLSSQWECKSALKERNLLLLELFLFESRCQRTKQEFMQKLFFGKKAGGVYLGSVIY